MTKIQRYCSCRKRTYKSCQFAGTRDSPISPRKLNSPRTENRINVRSVATETAGSSESRSLRPGIGNLKLTTVRIRRSANCPPANGLRNHTFRPLYTHVYMHVCGSRSVRSSKTHLRQPGHGNSDLYRGILRLGHPLCIPIKALRAAAVDAAGRIVDAPTHTRARAHPPIHPSLAYTASLYACTYLRGID